MTFVSNNNGLSRPVDNGTFQIDHCVEISAVDMKGNTSDCNLITYSHEDSAYHRTRVYLSNNFNSSQSQQMVLHRKHRRLIQLEHAAHCTSDVCLQSSCSKGKWLWKHMETCANNECGTPHCFSSRTLLAHYSNCEHLYCNVCAPVRRQILREQSKEEHQGPNVDTCAENATPNNNGHMLMVISEETNCPNSSFRLSPTIIKQQRIRSPSDECDNRTMITSNVSRMKH